MIEKDFIQTENRNEWHCTICTPPQAGRVKYYNNVRAAEDHEKHSARHAKNVAESNKWWGTAAQDAAAWDAPVVDNVPLTAEEIKTRESQMHVDHVHDMVPFWIRGMEAAERGEVLRLEEFLETLKDPWGNPVTYAQSGGWGQEAYGGGGWGAEISDGGWGAESEGVAFVDSIAAQQGADVEKRRRMHAFYQVGSASDVGYCGELTKASDADCRKSRQD